MGCETVRTEGKVQGGKIVRTDREGLEEGAGWEKVEDKQEEEEEENQEEKEGEEGEEEVE